MSFYDHFLKFRNSSTSTLTIPDLISTADVSSSDVDSTHSKSIYESEVTSPLSEDKPQDEDDEDLFDMM